MEPEFITTKDVSNLLNLSITTLVGWRWKKKNLPFYKSGRHIFYKKEDVDNFLKKEKEKVDIVNE